MLSLKSHHQWLRNCVKNTHLHTKLLKSSLPKTDSSSSYTPYCDFPGCSGLWWQRWRPLQCSRWQTQESRAKQRACAERALMLPTARRWTRICQSRQQFEVSRTRILQSRPCLLFAITSQQPRFRGWRHVGWTCDMWEGQWRVMIIGKRDKRGKHSHLLVVFR